MERPDQPNALLRCEKLVIGHQGRPLLPSFDFSIRRGVFTAIVGRNGSGKTTFFRTLLGLLPPLSGRIVRPASDVRLAYVGQGMTLDQNLPVRARDVVSWGLLSDWRFARPAPTGGRAACEKALTEVGAGDLAERAFRDLSEGQKQRVLLARVLVAAPDAAFLDEPTSAMDPVAEEEAAAHLARIARERRMAVVVISHTLGLAARFADEMVFLDRDGGAIVAGPPATVMEHPSFERQFGIGKGRHVG